MKRATRGKLVVAVVAIIATMTAAACGSAGKQPAPAGSGTAVSWWIRS